MPGILGIVASEGQDRLGPTLTTMIEPMRRQDHHRVERRSLRAAGLASIFLDDDHKLVERDGVVLALAGEIVDLDGLRAQVRSAGDPHAHRHTLSELLLSGFVNLGLRTLCGLNGIYVIAVWEDDCQKLTLINDRQGYHRMYYWRSQDRFLFATEMKSILRDPEFPRRINELGLVDLISTGYPLDDRTLFEDLLTLPAASVLTFQRGELTREQYWAFTFYSLESPKRKTDEYCAELASKIKQAVSRRARPNSLLLLTGGMDSRTVAAMHRRSAPGLRLQTGTIGREGCADVQFGRQIADQLGFPHALIPLEPDYLERYALPGVRRTEANMACHAYWVLAAEPFVHARGFDTVVTGVQGDGISGRSWPEEILGLTSEDEVLAAIFKRKKWRFGRAAEILKPQISRNVDGESFLAIRRSFETANAEHVLNKYDEVYFRQIMRHSTYSADVLGEHARVLVPFTDRDLIDYVLQIPPELRIRGYLYKRMILRHIPEVASLDYEKSGLPLNRTLLRENQPWLDLLFRAAGRARRALASGEPQPEPLERCIRYNSWFSTHARGFVTEVLGRKEYLEDYFDLDVVDTLVEDHMTGKRREFRLLSALVTFCLWRQLFCDAGDWPEMASAQSSAWTGE